MRSTSERSASLRTSCFTSALPDESPECSIHVALVALVPLQVLQVFGGTLGCEAALLGDDFGECLMHVARHSLGVAANVEMRAFLQPRIEVARPLLHPMLHVDLSGLVTRERHVHARQHAVLQELLPFALIEEIGGEVP